MSQWETRVKVIGLADSKQRHAFSSRENDQRLLQHYLISKSIEVSHLCSPGSIRPASFDNGNFDKRNHLDFKCKTRQDSIVKRKRYTIVG
jgi:hypothetical protein